MDSDTDIVDDDGSIEDFVEEHANTYKKAYDEVTLTLLLTVSGGENCNL